MFDHDDILVAINFERIKPLYRNGSYGIFGVFLACIFIPIFFWDSVSHRILIGWFLAILCVNIPRLFLIKNFKDCLSNGEINAHNIKLWEKAYYIGFFLSGIVWSSTIYFPFSQDIVTGLIFVSFILVGLNSSAIAIYSTSFLLMIGYLSLSMVPLSIRFFLLQDPSGMVLGTMCLIYYLMMFRMVRGLNAMIIENIQLKLDHETISLKDPLTGLYNRRRLYLFIDKLIPKTIRQKRPFSIVLMDIDAFKQYNDTQGHNAGDVLLSQVADILQQESRQGDLVVRYGGEEFLLVLPDTPLPTAYRIAERVRKSIKHNTPATISAGIAEYQACFSSFEELTRQADIALYQAKAEGKNKVVIFATPTAITKPI